MVHGNNGFDISISVHFTCVHTLKVFKPTGKTGQSPSAQSTYDDAPPAAPVLAARMSVNAVVPTDQAPSAQSIDAAARPHTASNVWESAHAVGSVPIRLQKKPDSERPVGILWNWLNDRFLAGKLGFPEDTRLGPIKRDSDIFDANGYNTYQVCRELIVVPDTAEHNCSYAEWIAGGHAPDSVVGSYKLPLVAPATHFVSHAWGFNFQSLLQACQRFVIESCTNAEEANGIYLWLDIFVVDQHAAMRGEMADDYWETTFQECIRQIGHTVVVLDQLPQAVPTALTRIWCIWEMYSTIVGMVQGNKLSVALTIAPHKLQPTFEDPQALEVLIGHISSVNTADANATVEADRVKINALVAASPGGHDAIDATVRATTLGAILGMVTALCGDEHAGTVRRLIALIISETGKSAFERALHMPFKGKEPLTWALTQGKENMIRVLDDASVGVESVVELDLNGYFGTFNVACGKTHKLSELPVDICRLTSIEVLDLSGNHLTALPAEAAAFVKLRDLNLSLNLFESVPAVVFELQALENLNLSSNRLVKLDDRLVILKELRRLDLLLNNDLTALPEQLEQLPKLTVLHEPHASPRERAVQILLTRFRVGIGRASDVGTATAEDVKELRVNELGETVFYVMCKGIGWGDGALLANLRLARAFRTDMGFHRMYFERECYRALGAPTGSGCMCSENKSVSMQTFEYGTLRWSDKPNHEQRGCWVEVNEKTVYSSSERVPLGSLGTYR